MGPQGPWPLGPQYLASDSELLWSELNLKIRELEQLREVKQQQLRDMIIMDDYDGGAANQLRIVIDDLRKLESTKFSKHWYEKKSEKTS